MKSKISLFLIILFFLGINTTVSQTIDLGSAKNFSLYTSDGAVTNAGQSNITGDIGSNEGDISGFEAPAVVNGTIHNANSTTATAAIDLMADRKSGSAGMLQLQIRHLVPLSVMEQL